MEPSHQRNVSSNRGGQNNYSDLKENQLIGSPLVATEAFYPNVNQVPDFYQDVQYPQQCYYSYLYPYYGIDYTGNPVYYPVQPPWQNPEPMLFVPQDPAVRPRHIQYPKPKQRWKGNQEIAATATKDATTSYEVDGIEKEVTETARKKKKRRNKKKTMAGTTDDVVVNESPTSLKPEVKEEQLLNKATSTKKVQFQLPEKEEKPRKPINEEPATAVTPQPLDYSKLFSKKNQKERPAEQWPVLTKPSQPRETKSPPPKTQTFADKLKDRPFLDWRDQRTVGPEPRKAENPKTTETPREPAKNEVNETKEDGWTQVVAKKKSTTAPQPVGEPQKNDQPEANKLKKEKRKQKEKEKKRRLREQKALEEKLAPKGRKVTILTQQMLQKLQSTSKNPEKPSRGIDLTAEDYPPLFATPRRISESDSEWETTEVEVAPAPKPKPEMKEPVPDSKTAKAIKRKDPIQLDLFSLIKVNKQKKEKAVHGSKVVRKHLVSSATNKLDSSAPNQYRGKIRNRKKKTTPLRRAIAQARQERREKRLLAAAEANPPPLQEGPRLHTRKFREYCDQMLTDEIDALAKEMLGNLRRFQDRAYQKDPIKGRMRKRLVAGLREVTKQVDRNRIKLIFLAPDIERCPTTGGLDEAVNKLLDIARTRNVPCVYALSRRKLGRILSKHVAVSCCATFNYQGTEEIHKKLVEAVDRARHEYALKMEQLHGARDHQESILPEEIPADKNPADQIQENLITILKTNLVLDN